MARNYDNLINLTFNVERHLGVIRRDEGFKAIFARLVSKHGIKMKAVVADQRRLLEMIYALYKTGGTYGSQEK